MAIGEQGRQARIVPFHEIRHSVGYLLSVQKADGSFGDPHPVVHIGVLVIATRFHTEGVIDLNIAVFFFFLNHSMAKMGEPR